MFPGKYIRVDPDPNAEQKRQVRKKILLGALVVAISTLSIVVVNVFLGWKQNVSLSVEREAVDARVAGSVQKYAGISTMEIWQTSQGPLNHRLEKLPNLQLSEDFKFQGASLNIEVDAEGHPIEGFGGAFTEASATIFAKLNVAQQAQIIQDYFGPDGIGYTLGRVHINSCDFSVSSYSFDDVAGDTDLKHFDNRVSRDAEKLIPLIKNAMDAISAQGKRLKLLASPWSPPAWMKRNNQMDRSSRPCLRKHMPATWAKYISRWIEAYKGHGVPIWAITVQNEPENNANWEACLFSPEQEAEFLGRHLGPEVNSSHPEVLIFAYDHNKDHLSTWAQAIYGNEAAKRHASGLAFHWYSGDGFNHVDHVRRKYPEAILLPSEATYERWRWRHGTNLADGDWSFGEGYAHDIIGDLNSGGVGWIDWNLLLDQSGGPNHVGNVCDAAMIADLQKRAVYRHPQYYYMGHFSKFILPGSFRLPSVVEGSSQYWGFTRRYGTCAGQDGMQATAFLRPDKRVVIVALNCGDHEIPFKIKFGSYAALSSIPRHSIQTYLI